MHYLKRYYVYIMSNRSQTLYVGVSSNLEKRVWQHKNHVFKGFTSRYRLDRLVYFEVFSDIRTAIGREKELKGWKRIRKIALIVSKNPEWRDLSDDWGEPVELKYIDPSGAPKRPQDDILEN
jgi:putative endonuclease